jgi:arabinan endo-1,5-alpha-L-arabinosidase
VSYSQIVRGSRGVFIALLLAACVESNASAPPDAGDVRTNGHDVTSPDTGGRLGHPATDGASSLDASAEGRDATRQGGDAFRVDANVDGARQATSSTTSSSSSSSTSTSSSSRAADAGSSVDASASCTTRVTYGQAWIHGSSHPAQFDVVTGEITWDGTCITDGSNSYATLSNGWQPYFTGTSACILDLDYSGACSSVPGCSTRIAYGTSWLPPANHPASYDDVTGRLFSDGNCYPQGGDSYANLSNGWAPTFQGASACALSFRYLDCGGLYNNPVIPVDCPDPGVLAEANGYVLSCTSGDDANAFPIYTSPDLVNWTAAGYIFPSGHWPTWAASDFWAPEIHHVGSGYVAYFAARDSDGMLSVGVAAATSPLGPFTDIGAPLVHDSSMGHIDPSEVNASDGTPYAIWKDDGNAIGQPTPIHAQQLSADGLSLVGSPATLITNDHAWEGAVTEAPFMVEHGGTYYLFYSGNAYNTSSYAVGVAQGPSPMGPFTKATGPILVTGGAWAGPGHCSVVDTPSGDTYMVFAAWEASAINASPGRLDLTEAVSWTGAWPAVPLAPSSTTRPMP